MMKTLNSIVAFLLALGIVSQVHADHQEPVELEGNWIVTTTPDGVDHVGGWIFRKKSGKYSGAMGASYAGIEFSHISVIGNKVTLGADLDKDRNGKQRTLRIEGEEKSPGKIVGKYVAVDTGTSAAFIAIREPAYSGEWDMITVLPDGEEFNSVIHFTDKKGSLAGSLRSERIGKIEFKKVHRKDWKLHVEFEFETEGSSFDVTMEAQPAGDDQLVGTWSAPGSDGVINGEWQAKRKSVLPGVWGVATNPNSEIYNNGKLQLTMNGGECSGSWRRESGRIETELTNVTFDGKQLTFSTPLEMDGRKGVMTVQAKPTKGGFLRGEWVFAGEDGGKIARETWRAKRF